MLQKIIIINVISLVVLSLLISLFFFQMQKDTVTAFNENSENDTEIAKDDRQVVLLLGSSVTQGMGASNPRKSWAGLLNSYLEPKKPNLIFINLGVGGYTTKEIINHSLRITSNFNAERLTPDMIIIETCSINDFLKLKSSQSEHYLETVVSRLYYQFPEAKVVLMPPNDVTVYNNRVNSEGLSYQDYVKKIGELAHKNEWTYLDFWELYEKEINHKGLTLSDTLLEDGKHPNDIGYKIWFNSLKQILDIKEL